MSPSNSTRILILFTLILFSGFAPGTALAYEGRSGEPITVAADEVIDDDLYVAGKTITIEGTINGDLFAAGRTVLLNGTVKGSVNLAGESITINGSVGHAARVAGRFINVNSPLPGDLLVVGSDITIDEKASIGGDLLFVTKKALISGPVERSVKGAGKEVVFKSEVKENVELIIDKLTLAPTAVIQGDLTYTSENEAAIESGAKITGKTTRKLPEKKDEGKGCPFGCVLGEFFDFLMALVAGIFFILLFPARLRSFADTIFEKPSASAGWGALLTFVTPIAAIIVCCTIVGIATGGIVLGLWGIAIYLAQMPVGVLIGKLIIGRFRKVETKGVMIGALGLGLFLLFLVKLIPILGALIGLAVVIFGMGAGWVTLRKKTAAV